MKQVIVIPARFQSSRLPGKPLVKILGKTLLERTWDQCIKAFPKADVYVATDDERIVNHAKEKGMNFVLTSSDCLTGTDRIYEASLQIKADVYINVQGDEPLVDPADILAIAHESKKFPECIINGMAPIEEERDYFSLTVPKVVTDLNNKLLYMSRGAIPHNKKAKMVTAHKQVCIYAFPKSALTDFYNYKKKTPLEEIEDIEILRFLEMGFMVNMLPVSTSSIAVDVPEDVARVEIELKRRGLS